MSIPSDEKMYEQVKNKIYKKYPKHSAYRSGLLVQAYKKEFSKVYGNRKSPYKKSTVKKSGGLTRWFKEKWISDTGKIGYSNKSSVYRPSIRITKQTPVTWKELSPNEIKKAKKEKKETGRVKKFKI